MSRDKDTRLTFWKEDESTYAKTYKTTCGKRQWFLEYSYYYSMITRATNPKYKERFPTYKDVVVEGKISEYNYFVEWSRQQKGFGNLDWVLDKDILVPHNKIYSEDTCVFVPNIVNSFFTFIKTSNCNEYPYGVSWCESEKKFKVYCAQLNGKNKTLGRFNTPEEAAQAYRAFKNNLAVELAKKYESQLDERVTKALYNFDVANY